MLQPAFKNLHSVLLLHRPAHFSAACRAIALPDHSTVCPSHATILPGSVIALPGRGRASLSPEAYLQGWLLLCPAGDMSVSSVSPGKQRFQPGHQGLSLHIRQPRQKSLVIGCVRLAGRNTSDT